MVAEMEDMDVEDARAYIIDTAPCGPVRPAAGRRTGYVAGQLEPEVANAPLSAQRPSPGQTMTQDVSSLPSIGDTDDYHIVTVGARTGTLSYTVVVAQASQIQADTISTVAWFMLGATPLLLGRWPWPYGCWWGVPSARSNGSVARSPGSTPSGWTDASTSRPPTTKSTPWR